MVQIKRIITAAGLFRKKPAKRKVRRKITVDARNGRLVIFGEKWIMYGSGFDSTEMKILRATGKTVTKETRKKSGLTIRDTERLKGSNKRTSDNIRKLKSKKKIQITDLKEKMSRTEKMLSEAARSVEG